MPVQDDKREQQMVDRFNLTVSDDRKRADVDAVLELEGLAEPLSFELKSTTKTTVATVRDFGPEHIAKWHDMHWLFAFYNTDGSKLLSCRYASPADMAAWISKKERYVLPDVTLAHFAPPLVTMDVLVKVLGDQEQYTTADAKSIMKNQWTAAEYKANADLPQGGYSRDRMLGLLQERCGYVMRRGATLNNPHIPKAYLQALPLIERDHAAELRRLVRAYLAKVKTAAEHGETLQSVLDPVVAAQAKAAATDEATE